jgi:periplasmic protein TonB
MTAAPAGPSGNHIFSTFSEQSYGLYRARREVFLFSLLGQVLVVALLILFTGYVMNKPGVGPHISEEIASRLPVVFHGPSGGGGGNFDKLAPSQGALPASSVIQLAPPSPLPSKDMPKLPVEATVILAPEIRLPPGSQIGDPWSKFSSILSNGSGGPSGIGRGCCDGVGPGHGPGAGPGPGGRYLAGVDGVTVPRAIYSPEPAFSEEARKSKTQGNVLLILVVGADGSVHNVRLQQSLGMGLDEAAIEAVKHWRFQPATYKGQPVDAQIAIEVNFHLY